MHPPLASADTLCVILFSIDSSYESSFLMLISMASAVYPLLPTQASKSNLQVTTFLPFFIKKTHIFYYMIGSSFIGYITGEVYFCF